jgi:hypothetical protein
VSLHSIQTLTRKWIRNSHQRLSAGVKTPQLAAGSSLFSVIGKAACLGKSRGIFSRQFHRSKKYGVYLMAIGHFSALVCKGVALESGLCLIGKVILFIEKAV